MSSAARPQRRATLARARSRAGRDRAGRAGRATRARRQAHGRCARSPTGPSSTWRRRALLRLSEEERNRRIDLLRLAESLGAETVTLDGPTAADALAEYARTRNATRVIVGAPKRRGWRALLRPSTAHRARRRARGFDVMTIAPADDSAPPRAADVSAVRTRRKPRRRRAPGAVCLGSR